MATPMHEDLSTLSMDDRVPEVILGRLAYKFHPKLLQRFANIVLHINDAKYGHLIDGQRTAWGEVMQVLLSWNAATRRYMKDLVVLLREAERLGFVENGTTEDVTTGRVWAGSYIDKCQSGPYPDFASIVRPWYQDPVWKNMLVFPWMDEETFDLSEVYTALEMQSIDNRTTRKNTALKDYKELFKNRKPSMARILIHGDPGIGKTTFTHKLALDWANGDLEEFDLVFVIKLRMIEKSQSLVDMIKDQIKALSDSNESDDLLLEYLKSGRDRVLLILDGLDEIDLKQHDSIQKIIQGGEFRNCCILMTTRPHVARAQERYMTYVGRIKGFSRAKAEEFIRNIILDDTERKRFIIQLDERRMSGMYRVPIILQALALLYREEQELPETYTTTYDQLITFLRQTCEASKGLNEVEIESAMAEANKLAYKGLICDTQQLIFSRDEIKDENVFRLGLLTGEMKSGFKPKTIVQFPHKTFQEHCAGSYVADRLVAGDRTPWDTIIKLFIKTNGGAKEENVQSKKKPINTSVPVEEEREEKSHRSQILNCALQKFVDKISSAEDRDMVVKDMLEQLLRIGAFDEEQDVGYMWEEFTQYYPIQSALNTEEQEVLFDFLVTELIALTTPKWREQQRKWVRKATRGSAQFLGQYFIGIQLVVSWIQSDPVMAKENLKEMASVFASDGVLAFQTVSQDFSHLWEQLRSHKTLLSFILGKLPEDLVESILLEITDHAIKLCFDRNTGDALPLNLLETLMKDLINENAGSYDPFGIDGNLMLYPCFMHLRASDMGYSDIANTTTHYTTHNNALRINGYNEDMTIDTDLQFLENIIAQFNLLRNISLVELDNLEELYIEEECDKFVESLFRSPVVSLSIRNVNTSLVSLITEQLPSTVQRLSVVNLPHYHPLTLPAVIHLTSLYLENSTNGVTSILCGHFPQLKKLFVINSLKWCTDDMDTLESAIIDNRMPLIEHIHIRFGELGGYGDRLVRIMSKSTLSSVELMSCELTESDGQKVLRAIRDGKLNHLYTLNLLQNHQMVPIARQMAAECQSRQIDLQMAMVPKMQLARLLSAGGSEGLLNLVSSFMGSPTIPPVPRRSSRDASAAATTSASMATDTSENWFDTELMADIPTTTAGAEAAHRLQDGGSYTTTMGGLNIGDLGNMLSPILSQIMRPPSELSNTSQATNQAPSVGHPNEVGDNEKTNTESSEYIDLDLD